MSKKSKKRPSARAQGQLASDQRQSFIADLSPEAKRGVLTVFLFALAALTLFSLFDLAGQAGFFIKEALANFLGWSRFLVPVILAFLGLVMFFEKKFGWRVINFLGVLLFALSFNALLHLLLGPADAFDAVVRGQGGGYLGIVLASPLEKILGFWGSLLVLVTFFVTSFILIFNTSIQALLLRTKESQEELIDKMALKAKELRLNGNGTEKLADEPEGKVTPAAVIAAAKGKTKESQGADEAGELSFSLKKFSRKIDLPLDLLDNKISQPSSGDIRANQYVIRKTLENFSIPVEMADVSVGPTVTQYTLKPADGIKLNKITGLSNDLALALAAHPIRIEAPIPGKSLIGVEVPNKGVAVVRLREIMESRAFKSRRSNLSIGLGKDVAGEVHLADIGKMPHLLVAGATGSGKSVYLNSLIISLLYQNSPDDIRFIMVDPKRVELTVYNKIPHLLTPVITDVKKTINALKWLISEMDRRYETLSKSGQRNIAGYNAASAASAAKMPYLILVVDELADLMVSAASEIEASIIRLAQMARAVGIHLILATQRPSVDVITGLIKANITTRIAFSVASLMDSRTILDSSGAEKLVGRGDMLYISADLSKPKRLQGAYVSDDEIKRVADYLAKEVGEPQFIEEVTQKAAPGSSTSWDAGDSDDEMLEEARKTVIQAGKASASYLQRRLKVGYARAARLLDLLEEEGVIGPGDGAKPREVLVSSYEVEPTNEARELSPASGSDQEEWVETPKEEESKEV